MAWLVDFAIRFRVLVVAAAAAMVFFGAARLQKMPVDILPEFSPPTVEIQTEALGLSAAEVEVMVSLGVEELMSGLPWLKTLRSESVAGLSTVRLVFEPGTSLMRARQLVQERLTTAFLLPNVAKPPVMQQPTSSTNRVMMISLSSKKINPIALSVVTQWTVKPKLLGVPGVAKVAIWGERRRQLQVQVDPEKMRRHGITQKQVITSAGDSLWVSNLSFLKSSVPGTGGFLDSANQRMEIRHVLPLSSAADLARIGIDGTKLTLGDVADVVEGHPPLIGDAIVKGGHGLLLVIEKFPGVNTLEVTRAVEAALDDLRPGLAGVKVDAKAFRPATFVEWSMGNIAKVALIGGLLAVLGVASLLLNWRVIAIGVVSIPLSLLAAGVVLYLMGATINALMLTGFGVAIGCIVDDLVVAGESLHRRMRAGGGGPLGGIGIGTIIWQSALEARRPIAFASLINLLAISPVFFIAGLSGTFIQPLAVAYILALLASLLVALTVIPAMAAILAGRRQAAPGKEGVPAFTRLLYGMLGRATTSAIAQPYRSSMAALVLAAIGVAAMPALYGSITSSQTLLPRFYERDLLINWEAAAGISQPEMYRITSKAAGELRALPGVRGVNAHFGRAISGDQTVGVNSGKIWIRIDPRAAYGETVEAIGSVLKGYPGIEHKLHTYLNDRLGSTLVKGETGFVVRVYGTKRKELQDAAEDVRDALAGVDGLWNVRVVGVPKEPQVQVEVDLAAAAQVGIKPGDVRRAASTLFAGLEVGKIFEAQKVFDVVVWSRPDARNSVSSVINAQIELPNGGHIRLADVASVKLVPTPSKIKRDGISQYADVVAKIKDRNRADIVRDVKARLGNVSFQLGYHPKILGEATGEGGSRIRLALAMSIAAAGILLLMQASLGSWSLAFAVFAALPLALSGGILAAMMAGEALTLGSLVGLLAVYTIAVRQGLAMTDHYRQLQKKGIAGESISLFLAMAGEHRQLQNRPGAEAGAALAAQAVHERMAPVILSAIAIALAVFPMILFAGRPGLEFLSPMAVVILGGVVTTTITVLFILPTIFLRFGSIIQPELNLE